MLNVLKAACIQLFLGRSPSLPPSRRAKIAGRAHLLCQFEKDKLHLLIFLHQQTAKMNLLEIQFGHARVERFTILIAPRRNHDLSL